MDLERKREGLFILHLLHISLRLAEIWCLRELAFLERLFSTWTSCGYLKRSDKYAAIEHHEEPTTINFRCGDLLLMLGYRVLKLIHI